ncbi:MAG: signal peptide peptidase SppA [Acidobacteria bacterium]|nr:signal peptide peptidase SppA [Acidobacteriota bacterium]
MARRGKLVLFLFALFTLTVVAIALLVFAVYRLGKPGVPEHTILEADFEKGVVEYVPVDPIAQILHEHQPVVRDLVEALERGADDERVVGFIARIGSSGMGMARLQELRDAVAAFGESGKPTVAWSETFGEFGPGTGAYYLATAFDEIYLQPSGDVNLTGFAAENPFLRGTLDKLGVVPRMDHRYEYKNAMNLFTEEKLTEPHREAMQALLDSWFDQLVTGVAEGRKKTPEEVRELIDRGPFLGPEALEAGLVDGLAYRDEVYANLRQRVGEDAELLYLYPYLQRAGRPHDHGETIALIYGVGGVARGSNQYDPLRGTTTMGSDSVTAAFREAIDDDSVRAILFRVDSPGGSYVASDAIWRETVRAKDAGKPVIVSMGDVAGSGGYFVAMNADKIVAQPGTITGSIGVLGGKLVTREMWKKVGITFDGVQAGADATIYSSVEDYSEQGWERFQAWLDRVYEDFTAKVADGRDLPLDTVRDVAKGRIWSGTDAEQLHLIDAVGGFPVALDLARQAAGLEPTADVKLAVYPRERNPWAKIFGEPAASSEQETAITLAVRAIETLRPVVRFAERTGLISERQELEVPFVPQVDGPPSW